MSTPDCCPAHQLGADLNVGDLVFIRVSPRPFREVAQATGSWTNHVGIVVDASGDEPRVAESTFPVARITSLSAFVRRSEHGRVAVRRLRAALTEPQQQQVCDAARSRLGTVYDTGFNLHSRRQFCSRFAREVLLEATGVAVGDVQSFATLFQERPGAKVGFWKLWFFGRIPWTRETVSPASQLSSAALQAVFDGFAVRPRQGLFQRRRR